MADQEVPSDAALLDHVGWRLWQAGLAWRHLFIAGMQEAGHGWFGLAQSNLLGHLDRNGTRQGALAERSGLTKQAVQQLVDDLETAGIVTRLPDPVDRRGRIVRYTAKGRSAMDDADAIKTRIEARIADRIGADDLRRLRDILGRVAVLDDVS